MNDWVPFSAVAIFATDAREEHGGLVSLINILPDMILVERTPASFSTLNAYVRISYDPHNPPRAVSAGLRIDDSAPMMTQHFEPEKLQQAVAEARAADARIGTIVARFGATNFLIHEPCRLNATVTWDDEEFIIGTLRITVATTP